MGVVRRTVLTLACAAALAVAGCGGDDEQPASALRHPALADLTVSVDPDGKGAEKPRSADVKCAEAGDSQVCGVVAGLTAGSFARTGSAMACTEQYGGPEVATVTGTFRGTNVNARYSRVNGCEISRWQGVADLLGAAG